MGPLECVSATPSEGRYLGSEDELGEREEAANRGEISRLPRSRSGVRIFKRIFDVGIELEHNYQKYV